MPLEESAVIIELAVDALNVGPILHNGWFAIDSEGRSASGALPDGFITRRSVVGAIYYAADDLGLFDWDVGHTYVNNAIWCLDESVPSSSFEAWAKTREDHDVKAKMKDVSLELYRKFGFSV